MEKQNAQIFPVSRGIFALCGGHIESGTHLRQNIVDGSEKACHGFLDRKKFRFSAGLLNGQQILNGNLNMQLFAQFAEVRQKRLGKNFATNLFAADINYKTFCYFCSL